MKNLHLLGSSYFPVPIPPSAIEMSMDVNILILLG